MILNSGSSLFSSGGQESITVDELQKLRSVSGTVKIQSTGNINTPLSESNLKSIVKIEGEGEIYCLFLQLSGSSSNINLYGSKINIDNELLIKSNSKIRGSSYSSINVGVVCKDFFIIVNNDKFYTQYIGDPGSLVLNKEDWPISYEQVDFTVTPLSDDIIKYVRSFMIDKPLIFNNSFEIFADHSTTDLANYSLGYFCIYKINE